MRASWGRPTGSRVWRGWRWRLSTPVACLDAPELRTFRADDGHRLAEAGRRVGRVEET
jgi:hypothetical protein